MLGSTVTDKIIPLAPLGITGVTGSLSSCRPASRAPAA